MSKPEHDHVPSKTCRLRSAVTTMATLTLTATLLGCATTSTPVSDTTPRVSQQASKPVLYTIKPGDRLSDIALKFTGAMANWPALAAYNGIRNVQHLAVGSELEIPAPLLQKSRRQRSIHAATIRPQRRSTVDEPVVVTVTAVNTNRHFDLRPFTADTTTTIIGDRRVKVVGSYFPKGVYTQPDSASKLIMRIAPGTVLPLQREYSKWYRVMTAEGIGYLRVDDGEVQQRAAAAVSS